MLSFLEKIKMSEKLTFTCTDRLNVTKTFNISINECKDNKKSYNENLLSQLQKFQVEVNSLMTSSVESEKSIVQDKNPIKKINKKEDASDIDNCEEGGGEEDEQEESENGELVDENSVAKHKSDNYQNEPIKKLCT